VRTVRVWNARRNVALGERVGLADGFLSRLRGLLGRPPLVAGEGLLITPCKGVHMFGMKYPIDVAFIDTDGRVVGLCHELAPGRRSGWFRDARHALELPAGTLAATGTEVGDRLVISGADTALAPDAGDDRNPEIASRPTAHTSSDTQ
jgi:uncharacterized protein